MDRSYKIYKSYHTSHHNTTKTHLQISTPPSSVQQRTDIHNLPQNHKESQASKLQASSNAPTLTTSPANHKETQPFLPAIQRSADASSHSRQTTQPNIYTQTPEQPPSPAALKNQPVRRVLPVAGLCRRGADSWLAEICVVFQKSAV